MKPPKDRKLPNPVNYSLWLLNYKPRSVKEMTLALKKRGFDEAVAGETVQSLLDWGYLNDESFKNYLVAKRKRNNPKGRSLVERELMEAGIGGGEDLAELYSDEEEQELIAKLLGQWTKGGALSAENRDRFYQRLYRRGFQPRNIMAQFAAFAQFPENDWE